jgi:hypothetical protein
MQLIPPELLATEGFLYGELPEKFIVLNEPQELLEHLEFTD